nr:GTPase IMAP family member 9 [Nothobranchius furzeri]
MSSLQLKPFLNESQVALLDVEEKEIRVVLIGKTGGGKSSTGNTILQRKAFNSTMSASSITSSCEKKTGEFDGQPLAVVDTPGLFDTRMSEEKMKKEFAKCTSFAAPGPHVFLVVINLSRFTEEEQKTVEIIQECFGKDAAAYTMVVFTHGDDLEAEGVSIERFISPNQALRAFISQCGGGYVVFNNRAEDPSQVRKLLRKIDMMVLRNGGTYFTNEMIKEARKAIHQESMQLLLQNVGMKLDKVRRLAEKNNPFLRAVIGCNAITIGAGTGAALGTLGGPGGTELGASEGTTVVWATAVSVKKYTCNIQ